LGFGGEHYKNFRIWVDDEIESKSCINHEDKTYKSGFLCDMDTKELNIVVIILMRG
jgi:hypothetical protein